MWSFVIFTFSVLGHLLFIHINPDNYGTILDSIWTQILMLGTNNFPGECLAVAD